MSTIESPALSELIDAARLQARVSELGRTLGEDLAGKRPIFVCVLKGSLPFFSDLALATPLPVQFDYVAVSSYEGTESSGVVTFRADLSLDIAGRDVVVVEDIVDTGRTMRALLDNFAARGPASLRVVTLLDKPSRREVDVQVDYCGFEIPDAFVVGYGLDYGQYFRNLPYVAVLERVPSLD